MLIRKHSFSNVNARVHCCVQRPPQPQKTHSSFSPFCFSFLSFFLSLSLTLCGCLFLLCLFMYLIRYRVIQYNANKGNIVLMRTALQPFLPPGLYQHHDAFVKLNRSNETQASSVQFIPFDVGTRGSRYFYLPTVCIKYPLCHKNPLRLT